MEIFDTYVLSNASTEMLYCTMWIYSPTELLHYILAGMAMMAMMSYKGDNTSYHEL